MHAQLVDTIVENDKQDISPSKKPIFSKQGSYKYENSEGKFVTIHNISHENCLVFVRAPALYIKEKYYNKMLELTTSK